MSSNSADTEIPARPAGLAQTSSCEPDFGGHRLRNSGVTDLGATGSRELARVVSSPHIPSQFGAQRGAGKIMGASPNLNLGSNLREYENLTFGAHFGSEKSYFRCMSERVNDRDRDFSSTSATYGVPVTVRRPYSGDIDDTASKMRSSSDNRISAIQSSATDMHATFRKRYAASSASSTTLDGRQSASRLLRREITDRMGVGSPCFIGNQNVVENVEYRANDFELLSSDVSGTDSDNDVRFTPLCIRRQRSQFPSTVPLRGYD